MNRTYHTVGDGLQTDFTYYDWDEMVNTVPQGGLLETSQTGTLADPDSLVSLAYVYDAVGNVMSITDLVQSPAQTQTFTYDALNRLTSAEASAGFGGSYSESYTYDDKGRMDSKDGAAMYYWAQRTGTCQANDLTPSASNYIKHAVQGQSGGYSYTYDCNGNAITRGDQVLIYDEENRLVEVQVNSVTVAEYAYDGDGNRVKSVVYDGDDYETVVYIGDYYEKITTVEQVGGQPSFTIGYRKYYYAGSIRLAMREDSDNPIYLIGDHLGSTTLVVDTDGDQVAKRSYMPFGETWGSSVADLPTTFAFTGQREAPEIGLNYYIARWYDSSIAHFTQADTVVPGAGNPQAWNRYAYVLYNPLKYTDPSGHFTNEQLEEWFGEDWRDELKEIFTQELINILLDDDVTLGDLLIYEINGNIYSGVFILDEEGNLSLWDMSTREVISLNSGINPQILYKNNGDNSFTILINNTSYSPPETINYDSDWRYGEDLYVGETISMTWDPSMWSAIGLGIEAAEITLFLIKAMPIPFVGITSLTIGVVDAINIETYIVAMPYKDISFHTFGSTNFIEKNWPFYYDFIFEYQ